MCENPCQCRRNPINTASTIAMKTERCIKRKRIPKRQDHKKQNRNPPTHHPNHNSLYSRKGKDLLGFFFSCFIPLIPK